MLKDAPKSTFLGSTSFVDTIKDSIRATSSEIPKRHRLAARRSLEDIIPFRDEVTDEQIIVARRQGYSLQEIAGHLSLHCATVSRRAKRGKDRARAQNNKT
jgi:DNA-directed RNA polymerase specialized sigma24 family protein